MKALNKRTLIAVLALIVLVVWLTGCTGNVKPNGPTVYAQAMVVCDQPVGVDRIELEAVQFYIVEGYDLNASPRVTKRWVAMTPAGHEAMTRNLTRILIQTQQLKAVQDYYTGCIATANGTVTKGVPGMNTDKAAAQAEGKPVPKSEKVKPEDVPRPKAKSDDAPADLEDPNSKKFWQFWKDNA